MAEISVITPVFNGEKYIDSFMKMLLGQSFGDFELIVVNDASPDNSESLLLRYADLDNRICYIKHSHNLGQGEARNSGLEKAVGRYVAYIDIDDAFSPDYLEKLLYSVDRDGADIVIANSVWCYDDGDVKKDSFLGGFKGDYLLLSGEEASLRYFQIFQSDMWIPTEPWGKLIRRDFLLQNGIKHDSGLYEDVITNFHELLLAKKVAFISDYLYFYNQKNANSATRQKKALYIEMSYHVVRGIYDVLSKSGYLGNKKYKEYFGKFYFRFIHGVYSFFANGGEFEDSFEKSILQYKRFLGYVDFSEINDKSFVAFHLIGFYREMLFHKKTRLFFLFIENLKWRIPYLIGWLFFSGEWKKARILFGIYIDYLGYKGNK